MNTGGHQGDGMPDPVEAARSLERLFGHVARALGGDGKAYESIRDLTVENTIRFMIMPALAHLDEHPDSEQGLDPGPVLNEMISKTASTPAGADAMVRGLLITAVTLYRRCEAARRSYADEAARTLHLDMELTETQGRLADAQEQLAAIKRERKDPS